MPKPVEILTGRTFGSLTVIRQAESIGHGARWVCRCECGWMGDMAAGNLKRSRQCSQCRLRNRYPGGKDRLLAGVLVSKFLAVWRASESCGEAAEKLGITQTQATYAAYVLRKEGKPVKSMQGIWK